MHCTAQFTYCCRPFKVIPVPTWQAALQSCAVAGGSPQRAAWHTPERTRWQRRYSKWICIIQLGCGMSSRCNDKAAAAAKCGISFCLCLYALVR